LEALSRSTFVLAAADKDKQHPAWKLIVKVRHPHRPLLV
jgi:hypothetical protein